MFTGPVHVLNPRTEVTVMSPDLFTAKTSVWADVAPNCREVDADDAPMLEVAEDESERASSASSTPKTMVSDS
jgi:hypothetical protein